MRAAGASPMQWSRATTVLTPKPKGGCRPLTLGRAGAKVLQPWISQWQSGLDAGGLPGTSVEAALAQVQAAFRNKSEGLGDRLLFLRAVLLFKPLMQCYAMPVCRVRWAFQLQDFA